MKSTVFLDMLTFRFVREETSQNANFKWVMSDLLSSSENGMSLRSEFMYADTVAVIRLLFLKYFELPLLPIGVMSKRKRQVKAGIYDKYITISLSMFLTMMTKKRQADGIVNNFN